MLPCTQTIFVVIFLSRTNVEWELSPRQKTWPLFEAFMCASALLTSAVCIILSYVSKLFQAYTASERTHSMAQSRYNCDAGYRHLRYDANTRACFEYASKRSNADYRSCFIYLFAFDLSSPIRNIVERF